MILNNNNWKTSYVAKIHFTHSLYIFFYNINKTQLKQFESSLLRSNKYFQDLEQKKDLPAP